MLKFETLVAALIPAAFMLGFIPCISGQPLVQNGSDSADFTLTELYAKAQSSIVQVSVTSTSENGTTVDLNTGFVYDKKGDILTTLSAIEGVAEENVSVIFPDGSDHATNIIGSDRDSDLAVLSVRDIPEDKLTPLPLGNSTQLKIGEKVFAIGNHFGLTDVLTDGVVGKLGVLYPVVPGNRTSFSIPGTILTDVPVNEGGSGSPLLNTRGEVVGVNVAVYSLTGDFAGISFAVPSNTAAKVARSLIEIGSYDHPWLGFAGAEITPELGKALKANKSTGFLVTDVTPGSPAAKAGIHGGGLKQVEINGRQFKLGGDIVIAIDNQSVSKIEDIVGYLEEHKKVGDTVLLTALRDGKVKEFSVILDPRPVLRD